MSHVPLLHSFPRAILHIDGDAFFASCEQSLHPELRGKPVITGKERGIISSLSYEAKALGIFRGMSLYDAKKICPHAVIIPSDYETYSLLSKRFFDIVRRYTNDVEEYGIDECFADITGMRRPFHMSYPAIAEKLQKDLLNELGFTFSIGLGPNKSIAKIASKWKKPHGLTVIPGREIYTYLERISVEKIWGVGPQTSAFLRHHGVQTARQFAEQPEAWVQKKFSKPFYEIWQELNGEYVMELVLGVQAPQYSVQKFRTFTPPSMDREFVVSQLSKNIENACIRLRRHKLAAWGAIFCLRTQQFRHASIEVRFSRPTSFAHDMVKMLEEVFDQVYAPNTLYRQTGVVLIDLHEDTVSQLDLFGQALRAEKISKLYDGLDELAAKYGKHTVFLGSSFTAETHDQHLGERGKVAERKMIKLRGESGRKRLRIPLWFVQV